MDCRRFAGFSEKEPRPTEIVLLEDSDLYTYHQNQQQEGVARADAQELHGGYQQPRSHAGMTRPVQAYATRSYAPTLDATSERSDYSRQYRLHATPCAPSTARKLSTTSVDAIPISHGAFRPGGAVDLFSRQHIGLLLIWTLIGFLNRSLRSLVATLFSFYLGYSDYQSGALMALYNLPWLFKFLAGFISDCFPINRRRRKPYIFIGLTLFIIVMIAMTFMHTPRSAKEDKNAAAQGPKYVFMILSGLVGIMLSMVAVEGTMIEFAQREGEFARGRTQCWCIISRYIGEVCGAIAGSTALNSPKYGGEFAAAVPLQVVFGTLALFAAVGLVITKLFFLEEPTTTSSQRLTTHFRRVWNIMQKKTTWQITLFGLIAKIGSNYEIPSHSSLLRNWLGAKPLLLNAMDLIDSVGYIIAAAIFMKFLLNTNWRKTYVTVIVLSLIVMIPVDIVTVFDIERNLPLYLSKAEAVSTFDAFVFILRLIVIAEVAEPGYEAVTYGVITTVYNLGSTVMSMCKNVVASQWPKSKTDTKLDTHEVRWHYMRAYIFKYCLGLVVMLLVLWLLPRQKRHLKEMNLRGAPNLVIPVVLFLIFAGLFVTSVTSNMLAMYESTACLVFAGGKGCGRK